MTEKWYRYCKLGIILNYHGHETFNFAGSDFDFDILATTSNKVMINGIYKDELPVVYDAPKPKKIHFTNDDLFETDLFSLLLVQLQTNKRICLVTNRRKIRVDVNMIVKIETNNEGTQIDKMDEVKGIPKSKE